MFTLAIICGIFGYIVTGLFAMELVDKYSDFDFGWEYSEEKAYKFVGAIFFPIILMYWLFAFLGDVFNDTLN